MLLSKVLEYAVKVLVHLNALKLHSPNFIHGLGIEHQQEWCSLPLLVQHGRQNHSCSHR